MGTTEMHVYYDVTCGNISDGHDAESLIRTNRYLLDGDYLMPETGMDTMVNAAFDNVIVSAGKKSHPPNG